MTGSPGDDFGLEEADREGAVGHLELADHHVRRKEGDSIPVSNPIPLVRRLVRRVGRKRAEPAERKGLMRRLLLKMSMTVDGYVAGPEGEMDWAVRTAHPEGKAWVGRTLREAGAHVIGRRLYTNFVGYWPTSDDPLAPAMNEIPKVVFSRSADPELPSAPGWEEPRVLGADLVSDIEGLKAEGGKDLLAQGGVEFARSLVQAGVVDEYRLVVHPVVLGSGLALFDGAEPFDLELVDAVRFPSGTQALTYRPH